MVRPHKAFDVSNSGAAGEGDQALHAGTTEALTGALELSKPEGRWMMQTIENCPSKFSVSMIKIILNAIIYQTGTGLL
jgi:hypothetical protein